MFRTQVKQPISSLRASQGASTDAGSGGGGANSFTWHQRWSREGSKGIERSAGGLRHERLRGRGSRWASLTSKATSANRWASTGRPVVWGTTRPAATMTAPSRR